MADLAALPDGATIVRLATPGGAFLPPGRVLPLSDGLRPSTEDEREGRERDCAPGHSVWDLARSTPAQARELTGRPADLSFSARVSDLRQRAGAHLPPPFCVEVLADPLLHARPRPGGEGHARIEGLARPEGLTNSRRIWSELRERLFDCFRSI